MDHDWDSITPYCKHCGVEKSKAKENGLYCISDSNITGVSHMIERKRLERIGQQMLAVQSETV